MKRLVGIVVFAFSHLASASTQSEPNLALEIPKDSALRFEREFIIPANTDRISQVINGMTCQLRLDEISPSARIIRAGQSLIVTSSFSSETVTRTTLEGVRLAKDLVSDPVATLGCEAVQFLPLYYSSFANAVYIWLGATLEIAPPVEF